MKNNNFEKLIPEITKIAKRMSSFWNNKFETNELISEAWIKGRNLNFTNTPVILRRAKFDMIGYIREQTGRIKLCDKKGHKSKYKVKYKPKYITNIGYEEDSYGVLDGNYIDTNLLGLENKELINILLEEISETEKIVIEKYFLEEKSLKEIGRAMNRIRCSRGKHIKRDGLSFSTISNIKKRGLNNCRIKLKEMEVGIL